VPVVEIYRNKKKTTFPSSSVGSSSGSSSIFASFSSPSTGPSSSTSSPTALQKQKARIPVRPSGIFPGNRILLHSHTDPVLKALIENLELLNTAIEIYTPVEEGLNRWDREDGSVTAGFGLMKDVIRSTKHSNSRSDRFSSSVAKYRFGYWVETSMYHNGTHHCTAKNIKIQLVVRLVASSPMSKDKAANKISSLIQSSAKYYRTAQLLGKVIVLVRLKTEKMNDHTLKDWSDGGIKDKLRFRDLDDLVNEMIVGGSSIDVEKWKADILKML